MSVSTSAPVLDKTSELVVPLDPQIARATYGAAVRDHGKDSFEAYTARQDLIEANIASAVRKALALGIPLRAEAKERLRALLDGNE